MSLRTKRYLRLGAYVVAIWNGPKLMQLWQQVILIPSDITICERGFSKQNAIRSHLRSRLNSKTLKCSYADLSLWAWSGCNGLGYHLQHLEKHAKHKDTNTWLIVVFFATNQDCILITQNTSFSIILCNPNSRWHSKIKCRCRLTFNFVFENAM